MTDRAAHLVDHVLPDVPVRQWVLSVPHRLRYLLAWDHGLCRAVAGRLTRAVVRVLQERARDAGVAHAQGGGVVVIQRFGGALNLNVHFHALMLDGVFAPGESGAPVFHPVPGLTALDVEEVLATIEPGIAREVRRRGLEAEDDASQTRDAWTDEAPLLAGLAAASVQGTTALGTHRGTRPDRLGTRAASVDPAEPGPNHARANGYSLHAARVVPAGRRDELERMCRYVLRSPVVAERLRLTDDGRVHLTLREPWRDGTTGFVFDPVEFLGRLAVLVPRPRINLLLYFGVLGARAAWRAAVVPGEGTPRDAVCAVPPSEDHVVPDPRRGPSWAALMQRAFGFDVLACPRCGGRMRLVALIERAAVIARILRHLGLPTEIPPPRPARAPPDAAWFADADILST
jgi:hypothetical protein